MTRASHLPRLRKLRRKMMIECVFSLLFTLLVVTAADLLTGPWWLSAAFMTCMMLYLLIEFLGYRYLQILPQRGSLRLSLRKFSERLRWLVFLSRTANISMGLILLLIMVMRVNVSADSPIFWVFLPAMILVTWLAPRNWVRRVAVVRGLLRDMGE
jgi:hypothetical protein